MYTLGELKERLCELYDPDDIIEALEISTEDLLDRFEDKLELRAKLKFPDEIEEVEHSEY